MSAKKIECHRNPLTLNERKATATFLSSEDGKVVHIRSRRVSLPHSYDDLPRSTSRETHDKILRLRQRRLARKIKQVLKEELARREDLNISDIFLNEDDFWEIQYDKACIEAGVTDLIDDDF